ncbi:MAG TPA: hypothetical protein VHU91_01320 [Mycobacteriales bacterium]|jgi:hypothetical protein|nr:hypothetical protein [Mycobacteriales bacterium]
MAQPGQNPQSPQQWPYPGVPYPGYGQAPYSYPAPPKQKTGWIIGIIVAAHVVPMLGGLIIGVIIALH